MTDAKRREAIIDLIKRHTADKTVDRATARKSLIAEGIYTQKGALKAQFGGVSKKRAAAG